MALRIQGWDGPAALGNVVLVAGLLGVPGAFAAAPWLGVPWVVVGWLALAVLCAGARYRLTVSERGYVLERIEAWGVPVARRTCLLDWSLQRYQSLEADVPEGLCLAPPAGWGEQETDCFGPAAPDRQEQVLAQVLLEVARLRGLAPPGRALQVPLHPELSEALDPLGRTWHAGSLRLATARLSRAATLAGLRVPAGSTVHLNAEGWLDPRRPDVVVRVTVMAPVDVAAPVPLRVPEAGTLGFDALSGRVTDCSAAEPFEALGVRARGPARWDEAGRWLGLVLEADLALGGFSLPRGTRLGRLIVSKDFDHWTAWLPEPLRHGQLGPLQTLQLSADLKRVTGGSLEGDVTVEGVVIRGGVMPVPLDRSGRVDLQACRERGLVHGA